jgi:hypothetical protein
MPKTPQFYEHEEEELEVGILVYSVVEDALCVRINV